MKNIQKIIITITLIGSVAITNALAQEAAPAAASSSEKTPLADEINRKYKRADIGSRSWSTAYHTCIVISGLFAGIAALLAKLGTPADHKKRDNLVAVLAALAALATTLNTTLKFNQKWIANRATRTALYELKTDLTASAPNLEDIRKQFKEAMRTHEQMMMK